LERVKSQIWTTIGHCNDFQWCQTILFHKDIKHALNLLHDPSWSGKQSQITVEERKIGENRKKTRILMLCQHFGREQGGEKEKRRYRHEKEQQGSHLIEGN